MKEQLISFETAKLAKEVGFDVELYMFYDREGNICADLEAHEKDNFEYWTSKDNFNNDNEYSELYSAPTQSLLQKYLREKHSIDIFIDYDLNTEYFVVCKSLKDGLLYESQSTFKSYEEALEDGLQKALEYLYIIKKEKQNA